MKKLIYIPIIFFSFISLNTFSQKDLLADQKSFGLTFLDGQKYPECQICNLKGDQKTQIDDVEQKIIENLKNSKVIAVGEIGLDYYYDNSPKKDQLELVSVAKADIKNLEESKESTNAKQDKPFTLIY